MRSDAERFRDILEAIERIERYTGGRTGFGAAGDVLAPSRNRKFVKAIRSGPSRDQVRLLEFAREERSLTELMALFGASNRTKFRNKLVRPLIDAGWLSMTIPDKPRSSKQQYTPWRAPSGKDTSSEISVQCFRSVDRPAVVQANRLLQQ